MRKPIHFDMETNDPDDVMTLALLATHPRVELLSVTLMPGTPTQVGLVRHVLGVLGVGVGPGVGPRVLCIGGSFQDTKKSSVSTFHDKWFGKWKPAAPTHRTEDVLSCAVLGGCTLLTGAPLKNLEGVPRFPRWVAQGGFAGDSVVPPEYRLPKFEGRETCPTFNFGGAPKVAEAMLASPHIGEKLLVSKNVCHGVAWDRTFHERVKALPKRTSGLDLVLRGMELYLDKNPEGKKLHDPLAMTVAIEPGICEFRRVEMYRQKGEWGARLKPDSDVQIAVSVDRERFFQVLTEA
jgi:pyrimidine-specific ribonucleoside hydrolase